MNDESTLAGEGPFLLPAVSYRPAPSNLPGLEGPYELSTLQEAPQKTSATTPKRSIYAAWSDSNDRAKARNPRDQVIGGRIVSGRNVVTYPPIAGSNERIFVLKNFKIDGAALRPDHRKFLAEVASWMVPDPSWRVFLEAHASRTGSARHDDVLSEDRYLATRAFLETELSRLGVDVSRVRISGEGVGFRHTRIPGEHPRARSVYGVVQPDPSVRPPQPFPPPSLAINWAIPVPPALLGSVDVENRGPIRADEGGKFLNSFRVGELLLFVPQRVTLGSRREETNVKVHVFFAAGAVIGPENNDVVLHGLRGASDQSEWITIGVHGILNGSNHISDAQISDCLRSVGINTPPNVIRLTGHSRGCDSVVATVQQKLIKTPIDRIVFLDEAVEHVSLDKKLADRTPDPARGSVRLNRVTLMVQAGFPAGKIFSYEAAHKSVNLLTGASARVRGATYFNLDPQCIAAIGDARLVEDAMALDSSLAAEANSDPRIVKQLQSLHTSKAPLPPRGSLTTGPTTATKKNIDEFCRIPEIRKAVSEILATPVLMAFINKKNLTKYNKKDVADWTPFAAHEFLVAEFAHELTE
jgi:outer membrane protein OmpA-like peptidoglycan-associated protein